MIRNQTRPLRRARVYGKPIVVCLPRAQRRPQLPEQVSRQPLGRQRRLLPLALDAAVVARRAVFVLFLLVSTPFFSLSQVVFCGGR